MPDESHTHQGGQPLRMRASPPSTSTTAWPGRRRTTSQQVAAEGQDKPAFAVEVVGCGGHWVRNLRPDLSAGEPPRAGECFRLGHVGQVAWAGSFEGRQPGHGWCRSAGPTAVFHPRWPRHRQPTGGRRRLSVGGSGTVLIVGAGRFDRLLRVPVGTATGWTVLTRVGKARYCRRPCGNTWLMLRG